MVCIDGDALLGGLDDLSGQDTAVGHMQLDLLTDLRFGILGQLIPAQGHHQFFPTRPIGLIRLQGNDGVLTGLQTDYGVFEARNKEAVAYGEPQGVSTKRTIENRTIIKLAGIVDFYRISFLNLCQSKSTCLELRAFKNHNNVMALPRIQ